MTSDSMNARPMIMVMRIGPAAPGLRPMRVAGGREPLAWPSGAGDGGDADREGGGDELRTCSCRRRRRPCSCAKAGAAARASDTQDDNHDCETLSTCCPPCGLFSVTQCSSGDGALEVDRGQHDEDERLQKRAEDAEAHHRPGDEEREDAEEDAGRRVLAEDVAEQPERQREDARQVGDDLERDMSGNSHHTGPHEVLRVADSAVATLIPTTL